MNFGFYQGELKIQEKAGVKLPKGFTDKMYRNYFPKAAQSFLLEQPMLFISSIDKWGKMWSSVISGKPGFITLLDERTMLLSEKPVMEDPLIQNISENKAAFNLLFYKVNFPQRDFLHPPLKVSGTNRAFDFQLSPFFDSL